MARHEITVQNISRTGLSATFEAVHADLEHKFTNNGREIVHIKNTNAATRVVTFKVAKTVDGQAVVHPTQTIAANTGDEEFGPFPKGIYNQDDGMVYLDFSAAAGVTVAVKKLPPADS